MSITIRSISAQQLEPLLPALVELLQDTVHAGSPMGFLAPLQPDTARDYWLVVRRDLLAGTRVLVGAFIRDRLVGSGQLAFSIYPNARHRAELQKLFVASGLRGQGVGRLLVVGLHDAARERGRSLILLNTRRTTQDFYKGLGYKEVGVVPGYSVGVKGERYDTVSFYQELSS